MSRKTIKDKEREFQLKQEMAAEETKYISKKSNLEIAYEKCKELGFRVSDDKGVLIIECYTEKEYREFRKVCKDLFPECKAIPFSYGAHFISKEKFEDRSKTEEAIEEPDNDIDFIEKGE